MRIQVNGKEREVADSTTVKQLVELLGLSAPLAVELNRKVCPKSSHEQTLLNNGDVIEIVTIVGGG